METSQESVVFRKNLLETFADVKNTDTKFTEIDVPIDYFTAHVCPSMIENFNHAVGTLTFKLVKGISVSQITPPCVVPIVWDGGDGRRTVYVHATKPSSLTVLLRFSDSSADLDDVLIKRPPMSVSGSFVKMLLLFKKQ